ncbi:hypothetical protein C9374_014642 [Naegleria lovaniensis]|uniref:Uncharacterized protein n=1 Tax=Naegleria lovaniensis TaxID=51637 RepID=A0AA88GUR4_NAELO|nr:uncharacterized protein C9374_014642 [Naegleria lovaniensis]KAG2389242.1 hypothetical protein C9374_014642 [Naegleria lovaniensis]
MGAKNSKSTHSDPIATSSSKDILLFPRSDKSNYNNCSYLFLGLHDTGKSTVFYGLKSVCMEITATKYEQDEDYEHRLDNCCKDIIVDILQNMRIEMFGKTYYYSSKESGATFTHELFDVDGSRPGRWGVDMWGDVILVFASLSEFDQTVQNDYIYKSSTNRMETSLTCFKGVARRFDTYRLVLVLTKPDILVEKIDAFDTSRAVSLKIRPELCHIPDKTVRMAVNFMVNEYHKAFIETPPYMQEQKFKPFEYHIVNSLSDFDIQQFKKVLLISKPNQKLKRFISPSLYVTNDKKNFPLTLLKRIKDMQLCDIMLQLLN